MLLSSSIAIYAGGVGSGPNAPCPQCGPHGGINKGDKVKLNPAAVVRNPKSGAKTTFDPDTIAIVNNVLPKVGNADQMVGIVSEHDQKNGKYGNMGYVKMQDLTLHKAVGHEAYGKID